MYWCLFCCRTGPTAVAAADVAVANRQVSHLLEEVRQLREKQNVMDSKITTLKKLGVGVVLICYVHCISYIK